jgi:hypothetical protein
MPTPEPEVHRNELMIAPGVTDWYQYYYRGAFFNAGLDTFTQPPAQPQTAFTKLVNVLPPVTGTLERRWGWVNFANIGVSARAITQYLDPVQAKQYWIVSATNAVVLLDGNGSIQATLTGASGKYMRWAVSRGRLLVTDGHPNSPKGYHWIGDSTVGPVVWGLPEPDSPPTPLASGAGNIKLQIGRTYAVAVVETLTNTVSHISPLSPSTGPLDNEKVDVTIPPIPPLDTAGTQSDHIGRWLLATADGNDPTTMYLLAELTPEKGYVYPGQSGTLVYTDNTPDEELLTKPVVIEFDTVGNPHGILFNFPPPAGLNLIIQHNGRIWGAKDTLLHYSKSIDEVVTGSGNITSAWEAAWPPANTIDISTGGDIIRALISYNGVLYIGTRQRIYAILGNNPSNFTAPQLVFQDAGILSQEAIAPVFIQGQPIGYIWITPDLRVLLSNFNTYTEIGKPIFNELKLAEANKNQFTVSYFGRGPYDVCIINLGNNRQLVFDLRNHKWLEWQLPTNVNVNAIGYGITTGGDPKLLVAHGSSLISFDPSSTTDIGSPIQVTLESAWLDFGDSTLRKIFNEVEFTTNDPSLQFTLEGASLKDGFSVIHPIVTNKIPVLGPLGTYKVFLAASTMRDQFYRYRIVSNTGSPVLRAIRFEVVPINRV